GTAADMRKPGIPLLRDSLRGALAGLFYVAGGAGNTRTILSDSPHQGMIAFIHHCLSRSLLMTVKETLEHIVERLPEDDQRKLLDFGEFLRWRKEQAEDLLASQEAASFSLPNATLRTLAAKHKAPQSWYDEEG